MKLRQQTYETQENKYFIKRLALIFMFFIFTVASRFRVKHRTQTLQHWCGLPLNPLIFIDKCQIHEGLDGGSLILYSLVF